MPLRNPQSEIRNEYVGVIQNIEPASLAAAMGLQIGDEVIGVNGNVV
ncbi:MAG: PDZ domain-containing protein, partial [Chloroflexi bacterium]|nr:PDZ domain-containing protein [Chloroflexota bacterium]